MAKPSFMFREKGRNNHLKVIDVTKKVNCTSISVKLALKSIQEKYRNKPMKLTLSSSQKPKPKSSIFLHPNKNAGHSGTSAQPSKMTPQVVRRRSNRSCFMSSSLIRIYSMKRHSSSALSPKKSQECKPVSKRKNSANLQNSSECPVQISPLVKIMMKNTQKERPAHLLKSVDNPNVGGISQLDLRGQHSTHKAIVPVVSIKKRASKAISSCQIDDNVSNNRSKQLLNKFKNTKESLAKSYARRASRIRQSNPYSKDMKSLNEQSRNQKNRVTRTLFNNALLQSIRTPIVCKFENFDHIFYQGAKNATKLKKSGAVKRRIFLHK
ncbi:unnamed protein product [Moneuplotes crassus]|uniref:Uncharacterized protein n=1 Tax=Euplotes crassus TaxID=5936 RepID=A0AAD1UEV0_EUPCR|nr:unnamed protein product [Moneuplotes crassus]